MRHRLVPCCLALALLAAFAPASHGQPAHAPAHGAAPLLYTRFSGTPGMRITFYQGTARGQTFDLPVTVGLRPGYAYRVKLTGLPDRPERALYPTVEVRGTLQHMHGQRASDHPTPIVFTQDEVERALEGVLLTNVVILEDPDRAVPAASLPTLPLDSFVPSSRDVLAEARQRGRIMAVVRMGELEVTDEDLARESVLGTILLPGDRGLPPPRVPPWVPWMCWRVYDPVLGPKPATEECLIDGGDRPPKAGIGPDGRLGGLDPSDTVAEYTDSRGQRRVVPSNHVCLCVPRFHVLRSEVVPAGYDTVVELVERAAVQGQIILQARRPTEVNHQAQQPVGMHTQRKPSANVSIVSLLVVEKGQPAPVIVGQIEELRVVSNPVHTVHLTGVCDQCCPPGKPLVLCKSVDRQAAQIGDVVTFELKFKNCTNQPMTDVVVTDSLTGRLEYVFGSAKSDRAVGFTIQENEAGSVILRWEMTGAVPPGQTGTIRFQARIR